MANERYEGIPSDAVTFATPASDQAVPFPEGVARAFSVGTAGDVVVETYDGGDVTIGAVAGEQVWMLFRTLRAATTADQITMYR